MNEAMDRFLALYRHVDGEWYPITGDPEPSLDEAIQTCLKDLSEHADEHSEQHLNRLQTLEQNIDRLLDRPRKSDRIRMGGRVCKVDDPALHLCPNLTSTPANGTGLDGVFQAVPGQRSSGE